MKSYDFSGYATKYNVRCSDGRIIKSSAFKHMHGRKVSIVFQHIHNDIKQVLGHGILEHRDNDGLYMYGKLDDSESGNHARASVKSGSLNALSIHAIRVKQQNSDVLHGDIQEVSLVLGGANPAALIDNIEIVHSADDIEILDDQFIVILNESDAAMSFNHSGDELIVEGDGETLVISHKEVEADPVNENEIKHADGGEVYDSLNDEQKALFQAMLALSANNEPATDEQKEAMTAVFETLNDEQRGLLVTMINDVDDIASGESVSQSDDSTDDTNITHNENEGGQHMANYDVFKNTKVDNKSVFSHTELNAFIQYLAKDTRVDFKHAFTDFIDSKYSELSHADGVEEEITFAHGVTPVETLFPDFKLLQEPATYDVDNAWVEKALQATHKSPFAKVRTMYFDTSEDAARAVGHVKGAAKVAQAIKVLKRETASKMITTYMELDREDIISITDFDIVLYLQRVMMRKLRQELAQAILIGDQREDGANKIPAENIRPVYTDEEAYVIRRSFVLADGAAAEVVADAIIDNTILAMPDYQGSGMPTFFINPARLALMKTSKDKNGIRIYKTNAEIAGLLGVKEIVEVPQMKNIATNGKSLEGIIVNLQDYNIGATKGGEIARFENFDIKFNKQQMLIETMVSGALTRPAAAIVLESTKA